jgi:hypothetical protein
MHVHLFAPGVRFRERLSRGLAKRRCKVLAMMGIEARQAALRGIAKRLDACPTILHARFAFARRSSPVCREWIKLMRLGVRPARPTATAHVLIRDVHGTTPAE